MHRTTIAGIAILSSLGVALVLGTQLLKGDTEGTAVVTVLGLLGLGISQLLGNRATEETKETTEQISRDLHNGTFERLLREALTKLVEEKHFPLEIQKDDSRKEDSDHGR